MKDLRVISTPKDVFNLVCNDFRTLDHEEVKLLSLSTPKIACSRMKQYLMEM